MSSTSGIGEKRKLEADADDEEEEEDDDDDDDSSDLTAGTTATADTPPGDYGDSGHSTGDTRTPRS